MKTGRDCVHICCIGQNISSRSHVTTVSTHCPRSQGDGALGPKLAQLQQELRDARRREEAALAEAASGAEEAERLAHELAAANSKLSLLQVARNQLQAKVGS